MNLSEKIEEIKRKPEHIRLRYVWFFVAVSMVGIVSIWVFSLKASVGNVSSGINNVRSTNDFSGVAEEIGEQKEMLEKTIKDTQGFVNDMPKSSDVQESEENMSKDEVESVSEKSEISSDAKPAPAGEAAPNLFPTE